MALTTTAPDDVEYAQTLTRAERWLVILTIGPIILFGVIGNILSIITLRTRYFRMFQSTFLLCALAGCDMAVLASGAFYDWISKVTDDDLDLALKSRGSCKVLGFVIPLAMMMSAWTLVLITLERFISVLRPDKIHLFSSNRIGIAWGAMAGVLIILHLYFLVLFDIVEFPDHHGTATNGSVLLKKHCDFPTKNLDKINDYNFWSDLFLGSLIPCALIFVFNAVIIKRLAGSYRQFGDRVMIPQPTKKTSSITTMLVAVSIVFLLTTLPVRLYQVGYRSWWKDIDTDDVTLAKDHLTYSGLSVIYYINNAINFVLYMVVNPVFRKAFIGVIFCKNVEEPVDTVMGDPITADHSLQPAGYGTHTEQEELVVG